jgi:hypothetical protein
MNCGERHGSLQTWAHKAQPAVRMEEGIGRQVASAWTSDSWERRRWLFLGHEKSGRMYISETNDKSICKTEIPEHL